MTIANVFHRREKEVRKKIQKEEREKKLGNRKVPKITKTKRQKQNRMLKKEQQQGEQKSNE